jgi:hypothetical protein
MPLEVKNEVIHATLESKVDGMLYRGSVTKQDHKVTSGTVLCYRITEGGKSRLECRVEVRFQPPSQVGGLMHLDENMYVAEQEQRLLILTEYSAGAAHDHVGNVYALLNEYELQNS